MRRICVIEDELAINKMLCMNLGISGYDVVSAYNGGEVLQMLQNGEHFDLALLDIMLPEIEGFELLQPLADRNIPIICLTAKGDIESKLQGLTGGAEDYIVKPFEMLELLVRIDKVLKRHGTNEIVFNIQGVLININERSVKKCNETLLITPMEFDLLLLLVKNKNVALTRDRLLNEVWGINYEGGTRTVDVHIAQIRRKTGLNIVSVPKIGYRLEV